jgi:hypothetical protein
LPGFSRATALNCSRTRQACSSTRGSHHRRAASTNRSSSRIQ